MKWWFYSIMVFLCLHVQAQENLIPNGSFEEYSECPSTTNPWTVTHWSDNYLTPDYFHSCVTGSIGGAFHDTPCNNHGCQIPLSGDAYAGIWCFSASHPESREYLLIELIEPLSTSVRYLVSFYVSLAEEYGGYSISTIGAALTTTPPLVISDNGLLDAEPQVLNDPLYALNDTANWVLITDTVLSRGDGERYLTIGNFRTDGESDTVSFNTSIQGWPVSYYYVDDVSVIALDSVPDGIEEQEELGFEVWPNPARDVLRFKVRGSAWQQGSLGVHVVDAVGREILRQGSPPSKEGSGEVDISPLPKGIYFLELTDGEGKRAMRRFVKQ